MSNATDTTIGTGTVLTLHYTVRDEASGAALETSAGREPLTMLYGQQGMLTFVQEALAGKRAGDEVTVTVPPSTICVFSPTLSLDCGSETLGWLSKFVTCTSMARTSTSS